MDCFLMTQNVLFKGFMGVELMEMGVQVEIKYAGFYL